MTTVVRPIHFVRRGRRTKAVAVPDAAPTTLPNRVPRVARLMALAIHFDGMLRKGVVADQSELAEICNVTQPRMTQIMNLLHLAPDIQEAILFLPPLWTGRDTFTERDLRPICGERKWSLQRHAWRCVREGKPIPSGDSRSAPDCGSRPAQGKLIGFSRTRPNPALPSSTRLD